MVPGADGKLRRTQPGLGLLAHGISERVARPRTLGNAIVPQVAAQILAAIIASEALNRVEGCNVYLGSARRKPGSAPDRRASDSAFHSARFAWADIDE